MVDTTYDKSGGNYNNIASILDKDVVDRNSGKEEANQLQNKDEKCDVIELAKRHIFSINMILIYLITSAVLINRSYICISR